MSMNEKFLFDRSFEPDDLSDGATAGGKTPPKRKFGEADLEQARNEGFAAGQQAGAQEAMQAIEQQAAAAFNSLGQALASISQVQATAAERQTREATEAAIAIVRKLFPHLAGRHGLAEIESVICDCLERLRNEPRIVIRVSDSLLDPVEERVTELIARTGFDGKIVFLSEDQLQPGDVRVEWADGGAERDSHQIWHQIDQIIERAIGPQNEATATNGAPQAPQAEDGSATEAANGAPIPDTAAASA